MTVRTSARNQLPGVVTSVKLGGIMAQVDVKVGEYHIVSVITREAAEELGLAPGDDILVIIKSTEVMVAKSDEETPHRS